MNEPRKMSLQPPVEPRFGVLLQLGALPEWQRRVIAALEQRSGSRADCVLVLPSKIADLSSVARHLDPSDCIARIPARLDLERSSTGRAGQLSEASLTGIRQRKLDFILNFGSTDVARNLSGTTRWGVWQFTFDKGHGNDSGGFWEIVDDAPIAFASLVQLEPKGMRILKQGCIRSHALLPSQTRRRLQALCIHWPWQVYLEIFDRAIDPNLSRIVGAAKPRRRLAISVACSFAVSALRRTVRELARELFQHDQWNVGIIDAPITSLLHARTAPSPKWLTRPAHNEFFADPFSVMRNGVLTILCERLDYTQGRGTIVALDVESTHDPLPVEIGPPVHLSYPYLFQHDGHDFCVPETHEAREVALYVAESFPVRWKRVATLVQGMPLLDATLFQFGGDWWLAASVPAPKGAECELHLYYADLLLGPWQPHPANPVKVDVRSARPAGTPFWYEGALYRPAQDCSKTYGGRVAFNRIVRLTRKSYIEECVGHLQPAANESHSRGLHTVSAAGNTTLVDAKRSVFVFAQFRTVLRAIMRKAFSLSRSP
jgi:hypothetical protein